MARKSRPKCDLPPTADVVFQYLFTSKGAEEGLQSFINAINQNSGRSQIKNVEIKNRFNLARFKGDKMTIVDVKATDENGSIYDVEMQVAPSKYFAERMLYYWARIYASQIKESEDYGKLRDHPEEQKPLIYWIDYLLNANQKTEAEMTELLKKAPYLAKTHEIYTNFTASERRREYALSRMKADLDFAAQREYSYDVGLAEGEAIGLEKGEAIGLGKGVLKAKRDSLLTVLKVFYPEQFVQSVYDRILQITDLTVLENLFQSVVHQKPYEELVKML